MNEDFVSGQKQPVAAFVSDRAFREKLDKLAGDLTEKNPATTDKDRRRAVTAYCRRMGQIPVKRVQLEFCKLTTVLDVGGHRDG